MKKTNLLTKTLAVIGTLLVWFPILAPILLSVVSIFKRPGFAPEPGMIAEPGMMPPPLFRFDWLMPAELFPVALAGTILLIWAALRARSRRKLIIWSFITQIGFVIGGQAIASFTGLASGETEPVGLPWALVIASLVIFCLALVSEGIGGVLLLKDLFRPSSPVKDNSGMTRGRFIFTVASSILFYPGAILALAWNPFWVEGWIFGLWFSAMVLSNVTYLYLKDPALLKERSRIIGAKDQKRWDKYLLGGICLIAVAWFVIMPLDAQRFGWSPDFPLWLEIAGGLLLIPSLYLIYRSTVENTFLSTMVRIQTERKQHVISSGVYGFVRHPLYLGCMIMMFAAPLLLGSVWGLVIALAGAFMVGGRIIGEEKMLAAELDGYRDYRKKVTYRLIPFIW